MIRGSDFEGGRHVLVANSAEEWAAQISSLFSDRDRCERLRRVAYDHVKERYCWAKRARALDRVYARLGDLGPT